MSGTAQKPLVSEGASLDLTDRGQTIYTSKLKERLEAEYPHHFVAIHVDSEDYEVARSSAQATRAIQMRHPLDGRLYIRKIGSEPEYGLTARLLAGEMMATPK